MTSLQLQILALCAEKRMTTRELTAQLSAHHETVCKAIHGLNARLALGSTRGLHSTTTSGAKLLRSFKALEK